MVNPWTWTFCMALTICHWSSMSHALSAGDLAATANSSTSATNNSSPPILLKPVYTEGGAVLNNAAGEPSPESAHLSKKRVLSQEPPVPAPVHELPVNATTAKNAAVSSMERPLQSVNITSSSSTTTVKPSSTVKVLNTTMTTTTTNTTHLVNGTTTLPNVTSRGGIGTATTIRTNISTTSSSTSSSSTTTSTTTTTPKPKKPTITVSLNDDPSIVHVPSIKTVSPSSSHNHVPAFHNNLVEEPIAQLSRENLYDDNATMRVRNSRRDLVIPVVSLIFTIPMILGLLTIVVRKFRDYWHTRHYRRMDFLVDGIYND